MASAPSEPKSVFGRLDRAGRLISADPDLETLQRDAGAALGQQLALPQLRGIADLARRLGTSVSRPAVVASADHDIELWVTAAPQGEEMTIRLDDWTVRQAASPRLAAILGGFGETVAKNSFEWTADEELRVLSLSPELAERLGVELADAAGAPLTRLVRLEEGEDGDMPLISALAARRAFSGQRARARTDEEALLLLAGEVVTGADGSFAGFRGRVDIDQASTTTSSTPGIVLDPEIDRLLRSPVDRIIETAEKIVAGEDGPLRADYASYGNDIASAARHLMSVLRSMSEEAVSAQGVIDLATLSAEAVIMLESSAEERRITIDLGSPQPLPARGQERGVIQILVNLIVNAIRYSPDGGTVRLSFAKDASSASVSVTDEGPGIAPGDEQRIFERFERGRDEEGGTGLGLAISRRLARSMGGDVTLDSVAGEGARFTLSLPAA